MQRPWRASASKKRTQQEADRPAHQRQICELDRASTRANFESAQISFFIGDRFGIKLGRARNPFGFGRLFPVQKSQRLENGSCISWRCPEKSRSGSRGIRQGHGRLVLDLAANVYCTTSVEIRRGFLLQGGSKDRRNVLTPSREQPESARGGCHPPGQTSWIAGARQVPAVTPHPFRPEIGARSSARRPLTRSDLASHGPRVSRQQLIDPSPELRQRLPEVGFEVIHVPRAGLLGDLHEHGGAAVHRVQVVA